MTNQMFEKRLNRIITASEHKEPDRVPVLGLIDTWSIAYAGKTIQDCINDRANAAKKIYSKVFRDVYVDANLQLPLDRDMKFFEIVGNNSYFISEDGTTIQHDEGYIMAPEDYPELIKDPTEFLIKNYLPKKYPGLTIEKMIDGMKQLQISMEQDGASTKYFEEELGIPLMLNAVGPYAYPPLDIIFDYLRGFAGTTTDLRRRPQQVVEAMDAIMPWSEGMLGIEESTVGLPTYPFVSTMMHIPTFISPKLFNEYFVPTYEKLISRAHKAGKKLFLYLEGEWEKHYDWLNSLPKNFVIALVEHDDFIEAKKKIGGNITIAGGMKTDLLKYGTKQECLDHAKKIVDACAPGGGFIFTSDKILLTDSDSNIENLQAVHQFVHEYAVYK